MYELTQAMETESKRHEEYKGQQEGQTTQWPKEKKIKGKTTIYKTYT
jgi:hypothetical protein